MDDDEFRRGDIDIQWLERRLASILERSPADETVQVAAIAAAMLADRDRSARTGSGTSVTAGAPNVSVAPDSWKQAARLEALRD
jgi:hypothetical protein